MLYSHICDIVNPYKSTIDVIFPYSIPTIFYGQIHGNIPNVHGFFVAKSWGLKLPFWDGENVRKFHLSKW